MQLEARRAANTRAWLVRAVDDLGTATDLSNLSTRRLRSVVFHCQQAVEKALKGFLTWHDQPFGKTMIAGNWGGNAPGWSLLSKASFGRPLS